MKRIDRNVTWIRSNYPAIASQRRGGQVTIALLYLANDIVR